VIARNYWAQDDIGAMCGEIRSKIESGKRDVAGLGRLVDRALAGVPEKNEMAELGAILRLAKSVRYTRDPVNVDTIRAAGLSGRSPVTSTWLRGQGDCDDLSALAGAAAEYAGYPVRLVVTGRQPGQWKHVYPEARTRRHGWVPMDATEKGQPLGWRAPLPRAVYDAGTGQLVPDAGLSGWWDDLVAAMPGKSAAAAASGLRASGAAADAASTAYGVRKDVEAREANGTDNTLLLCAAAAGLLVILAMRD
jgi:hypothetical protein